MSLIVTKLECESGISKTPHKRDIKKRKVHPYHLFLHQKIFTEQIL